MVLTSEQRKQQQDQIARDVARIKEEQRQASLAKYAGQAIPISQAPKTIQETEKVINVRLAQRGSPEYVTAIGGSQPSFKVTSPQYVDPLGQGVSASKEAVEAPDSRPRIQQPVIENREISQDKIITGEVRAYQPEQPYLGTVYKTPVFGGKYNITMRGGNVTIQTIKEPVGQFGVGKIPEGKLFGLVKTPTIGGFKEIADIYETKADIAEQKYYKEEYGTPLLSPAFYTSAGYSAIETPFRMASKPVESGVTLTLIGAGTMAAAGMYPGAKVAEIGIYGTASDISSALLTGYLTAGVMEETKTGGTGAKPLGQFAFFSTPSAISGVKSIMRSTKLELFGEYVPPEKVFDIDVLSKRKTFPTTRSIKESLSEFGKTRQITKPEIYEKPIIPEGEVMTEIVGDKFIVIRKGERYGRFKTIGDVEVAHATSVKLSSEIKVQAQPGTEGAKLLEDPGLYVTPKGRASPYFLKISPLENVKPEITLFPETGEPTVIEVINIKSVKRYPRSVLESPGFGKVEDFLSKSPMRESYITKRSEIGLGSAKSYGYGGTREIEAIISPKTELTEVSSKRPRYTIYDGEYVNLREFKITGKETTEVMNLGLKEISGIQEKNLYLSKPKYSVSSTSSIIKPYYSQGSLLYSGSSISSKKLYSPLTSTSYSEPSYKLTPYKEPSYKKPSYKLYDLSYKEPSYKEYKPSRETSRRFFDTDWPTAPSKTPPPDITGGGFKWPRLKSTKEKGIKLKPFERGYRYTRSLTSQVFGIKTPMLSSRTVVTGFELR